MNFQIQLDQKNAEIRKQFNEHKMRATLDNVNISRAKVIEDKAK